MFGLGFLDYVLEKLYDFYYKYWGRKRWSFGDKWNAMIEREESEMWWRQVQENWAKGLRGNGQP